MLALLPEIVLSVWAMIVLLVDVFQKGDASEPSSPVIGWLTLAGIVARRRRERLAAARSSEVVHRA